MYYYLTNALKRRLIVELRDSFSRHVVYKKISPFIQNKYSFSERPQFGIIVKGSSGSKLNLAADNFLGTVQSYVMLAYVGQPANPIEWVREDTNNLVDGVMPLAPGVYYIEILKAPTTVGEVGAFVVDPLLTVFDQPLIRFKTGLESEAYLQHMPFKGTVRIWESHRALLTEGTDYSVNYEKGSILFLVEFAPNTVLTVDYRYAVDSIGPVDFRWNSADWTTLPGVIMAFGKRAEAGQKVAVVVYADRVSTANAYGGRFEGSFDLDVITRDPDQTGEIADLVFMYLWGEKRSALSSEGIELLDVSLGGEAEEVYDETGDDYFYQVSLSVQFQSDWEIHVPLPLVISKILPETQLVHSDIFYTTQPVIVNKTLDFERIA